MDRRTFVRVVPTLGAFLVSDLGSASAQDATYPPPAPAKGAPLDDSFPSHHPALAREMVAVAHGNLARVTQLLDAHPALAKASWDWGFGDWETALGAASHVGNRAIAALLLEHGAPPTLFSAAMLGQLDVVKAILAATPAAARMSGPHSIPLLAHAQAGGPQAAAVVKFLESVTAGQPTKNEALTAEDRALVEGEYTFGARARDRFIVAWRQNALWIERAGAERRRLVHLGGLEFHPVGASAVKIRFERADGKVVALGVFDPDLVVTARRQA